MNAKGEIEKITGCNVIDVSKFDAKDERILELDAIGYTIDASEKRIDEDILEELRFNEFVIGEDEQKPTIYKYIDQ